MEESMASADAKGAPSPGHEVERTAPDAIPVRLEETIRAAREYAAAARSPNTLKAYDSDVRDFSTYCRVELGGALPLPAAPETVALYITDMAQGELAGRNLSTSTIQRRLASISAWHKRAGHPSQVRRSKTDSAGEGEAVGIPYGDHEETCPITALEGWLTLSGRTGDDRLFCQIDRHGNLKEGGLSEDAINDLVKRRVAASGLDALRYSGHSLRPRWGWRRGCPTPATSR